MVQIHTLATDPGMRPSGAFWAGRGKSRGGPFGGGRMFDQGHLKFVILRLLDEKPPHHLEPGTVGEYAREVRDRAFPGPEHTYSIEPAELEAFRRYLDQESLAFTGDWSATEI